MPFAPEFKLIYDDIIKPLEHNEQLGLNRGIKRGDDFFSKHDIMDEIWSGIYSSRILIDDCTGQNPNVFYELGIAHTLGKPVILLAQNEKDIKFDVNQKRHILYNLSDIPALQSALRKAILQILNDLAA
jgi:hypothetical protein